MNTDYRELYNTEKHRSAGLKGENTRLRKTNAALHKHWQERFHPFRVDYELPTNCKPF